MNTETTFNAGDIVFVRDVEGPQAHKIIEVNTTERVDSLNKKNKRNNLHNNSSRQTRHADEQYRLSRTSQI